MNIIVFSDSHGHTRNMISTLQKHPDIEYVLHLGDYGTDISEVQEFNPTLLTDAVQGNNDKKKIYQLEKVIILAGKKILITHGHNYNVRRNLTQLVNKGLQENFSAILFGHTHEPFIKTIEGILLVNPGSIFSQRDFLGSTYAILTVTKDGISAEILKYNLSN